MKNKKIIFISILFLILFLIIFIFIYNYGFSNFNKDERIKVSLNRCVDGDTVWLNYNNDVKKFRLLGIDTPEVDESLGKDASLYTCKLLSESKTIEIEYDKIGYKRDKYNRELVWIFVDGELLQLKLLDLGFARVRYIYANYLYLESLYDSENNAIDNRVGIWSDYTYHVFNDYYTITFDYTYKNKSVKVLKNSMVGLIENPYKDGCTFVGWKNGNYLFDLSSKINKDYKLKASFDC